MIDYLITVSICTIVFYVLYFSLYAKTKKHNWNRFYLLSALLISIVIPLINLPVFPETKVLSTFSTPLLTSPSDAAIQDSFDWNSFIISVYWIGVLFSLGLIIKRLTQLKSIISNGNKITKGKHNIILTQCNLPLSSFASWIFVPFNKKDKLTDYELSHEICHINNFHTFDILLIEVYKSFFWFNPIMYFYKKSIVEIHEYQADQYAAKICGKEEYQAFLLDQTVLAHQPSLVNNFNSIIKKRLIMMNSKTSKKQWTYLLALPLLFSTLFLFSFDSYPVYVDEQRKPISIMTDTIIPGATLDTISMYNVLLDKEVKRVIVHPKGASSYMLPSKHPDAKGMNGIDTLSIIDYDTYVETMIIYNYETGVIDTIKYN